jgi:hypothetical protein
MTNNTPDIELIVSSYVDMLKDGQIDLQDAYENGDHKTYFSAIERHLKLTEAIDAGLRAAQKIKALGE